MLAEQFDAFLLDLDGVVYVGDQVLPGVLAALSRLRQMGKPLRFLTNDPRPRREDLVARLEHMGITVTLDEMITSGWATAQYLQQQRLDPVYVVGSAGLAAEIQQRGITVTERDRVAAVVIGCDEQVTYGHIRQAALLINQGARFVATNADTSFPMPEGPYPATGAIVAAVQATTRESPVVIGKPAATMFEIALASLPAGLRVAMIGDNPTSDILGAHQIGLTGILLASESPHYPSAVDFRQPDSVIHDLQALFDASVSARTWNTLQFPWPDQVEPGIAAVVFNEQGHVLLMRRADNGLWGLPSGHLEPGETVEESVRREVFEETGLEVKVVRLIGIYSDPVSQIFSYPSGASVHFVTCCCQCIVVGGTLAADGVEALDAAFFDRDRLPADLLPMHPQWLADALDEQKAAFIR